MIFLFAESSIKSFDGFYSQICILFHGSCEKFLKAELIRRNEKPPRIHDLVTLLLKINDQELIENFEKDLRWLSRFFVPLRYPSNFPERKEEDAKKAYQVTKKLRNKII